MSGVYLPGISLPEPGQSLKLRITSTGEIHEAYGTGWEYPRPLGHTAIPVPDHGRCVDAEELWRKHGLLEWDDENGIHHKRAIVWMTDLQSATTIIPADHFGGVTKKELFGEEAKNG